MKANKNVSALGKLLAEEPAHTKTGLLDRLNDGIKRAVADAVHKPAKVQKAPSPQTALLNALPASVALLDSKGTIIEVNEAWKDLGGGANPESCNCGPGENYISFLHKSVKDCSTGGPELAQGIQDILGGKLNEFIFDYECRASAEKMWMQARVSPTLRGRARGAVVMHFNVTGQKLAEEKIRTSEANLAAVIENTGASVYSIDTEFRYITFNGTLKTIMKAVYGVDLKPGDKIFGFLEETDPAEARYWEKMYSEALTGKAMQFVKDYSKAGTPAYISFSVNPIWEGKKIIGLSCLARDITRKRLAEDELRASEQRFRHVSQNPILGIAWLSPNGKILNANEAFANMLGYSHLEMVDMHYSLYTHPDELEQQGQIYEQLLQGQTKSVRSEKKYITKRGETIWGELILSAVCNGAGEVKYIIGAVQDITARKKMEEQLIALNESLEAKIKERTAALEEANRELEAFSYTVAHDLQSPIRTLCGFSKIMLEDYGHKLDDSGREQLQLINRMAKRMSQLTKDLLAFSKGGKTQVEKYETDMHEVVSTILEETKLTEAGLAGEIKVNPLPRAYCDPALIKQVWSNLIQNAIKYSKNKEPRQIEIGAMDINSKISYYVKDNGAGFDMKNADKLFGVFQRLHKQEEFEGTGIGLATAHRIIHRHGGEIWADAKVNEGATFYFTLADK